MVALLLLLATLTYPLLSSDNSFQVYCAAYSNPNTRKMGYHCQDRYYIDPSFTSRKSIPNRTESGILGELAEYVLESVQDRKVYGVFDGHGEPGHGEYIAEQLAAKLCPKLKALASDSSKNTSNPTQAISDLFEEFDKENFSHGIPALLEAPYFVPLKGGSTATVAVIQPDTLTLATVGDSRAFLFDQDGQLVFKTQPHSPLDPHEAARITNLGGYTGICQGTPRANGLLAMTRAFGDWFIEPPHSPKNMFNEKVISARPAVSHIKLERDSEYSLFLMTDGATECAEYRDPQNPLIISSQITDEHFRQWFTPWFQEITRRLQANASSNEDIRKTRINALTKLLTTACRNHGSTDDATAVGIQLVPVAA